MTRDHAGARQSAVDKSFLETAGVYAAAGIYVFPVCSVREDGSCSCADPDCEHIGKHPDTPHGFKDATTDLAKIEVWERRSPEANVGIATEQSGLIVVDADCKHGAPGLENWAKIVAELGAELEDTAMVRTQSGGLHIIYRAGGYDIASSTGSPAPGIDIRARGGYIVAPPSVGVGGSYEWIEGHGLEHLRELPEALAERLTAGRSASRRASGAPQAVPEGERNTTLASMAGAMRRKGMTDSEMLAALTVANAERFDPPLPEAEVQSVVASIASYEPAPPFENLTDTGNAHRLIRIFGARIHYSALEKAWYIYDGARWRRDEVLQIEDLVKEAHRTIYEEAARCDDRDAREATVKWAKRSESRVTRKATVECARSDPRVAIHPEQFDADRWLLNCPNGTLDLRTGVLRDHDPRDLITRVTGADYEPGARSALWERFLAEATGGDQGLAAWLQRAAGYSCTGDYRDEVYFVPFGETATGKTTFTEALSRALGTYAVSVNQEAFLARGNVGGTRDSIMPLEGRRLAVCSEFDRGRRFDEPLIKQLVGGDTVTGRRIYEHEHSFTPTAKLWLHTNHLPRLSDDDDASWRRIRIVPFRCQPALPDPALKAALCDATVSGPAILAWMVAGCAAWQREGLGEVEAVTAETRVLRLEMDKLGDFFDENCVFEDGAWMASSTLREFYMYYVETNHVSRELQVTPGKEMAAHLKRRGCAAEQRNGVRGWLGIRHVTDPPQGALFPSEER